MLPTSCSSSSPQLRARGCGSVRGGGGAGSSHHHHRIGKAVRAPLSKRAALRGVAARAVGASSSSGFDPLAEKFYTAEDLARDEPPTWSKPEKAAEAREAEPNAASSPPAPKAEAAALPDVVVVPEAAKSATEWPKQKNQRKAKPQGRKSVVAAASRVPTSLHRFLVSSAAEDARQWIQNWRNKALPPRGAGVKAAAAAGPSPFANGGPEEAKQWIQNWKDGKTTATGGGKKKKSPTAAQASPSGSRAAVSAGTAVEDGNFFQRVYRVLPDARNNRSLWGVGLMQLLWTASTLMYVSVLPVYMKQELGLSNTKIGVLEGAAVASAFFSKVFSGVISDALRSRTAVIFVGAMLTLACKPMFAASAYVKATYGTAVCFYWIFSGKIADRLSKGIRAAPTDALLADLSPGKDRSKAFSLTQSLATFGGVLGSALTAALLFRGASYETIFMLAAVPSALAIVMLFTAVKQPELDSSSEAAAAAAEQQQAEKKEKKASGGFREVLKNAATLPWQFYFAAVIVSTLYVARFSESFVVLRAKSLGWSTAALPLLLTSNQILQGFFTYPMGMLADNLGKKQILTLGFLALILANCIFIFSKHPAGAVVGFLVVGLHMSMTQANTKALLTEYINPTQRGTAFAMFAVFSGFALSFGNTLAGILNDQSTKAGLGNIGCFYGGATATAVSLVLLLIYFQVVGKKTADAAQE